MAAGTTLTVSTRRDRMYKINVVSSDAGNPGAGSVQFLYDDAATQSELINALEQIEQWVLENVVKR